VAHPVSPSQMNPMRAARTKKDLFIAIPPCVLSVPIVRFYIFKSRCKAKSMPGPSIGGHTGLQSQKGNRTPSWIARLYMFDNGGLGKIV